MPTGASPWQKQFDHGPRCCFGATPLVGELPRSNGQTTAWPSRAPLARACAYADDFVILVAGVCGGGLGVDEGGGMTRLGLTLNKAKTSLKNARARTLRLPRLLVRTSNRYKANGHWYLSAMPVQEERATAQDEGWQSAGAWQQRSHGPRPINLFHHPQRAREGR